MATSAISGHSFLQGMEKHLQGRFPELTDPHGCTKSMDFDKVVSEVCSCFSDSCAAISSASQRTPDVKKKFRNVFGWFVGFFYRSKNVFLTSGVCWAVDTK